MRCFLGKEASLGEQLEGVGFNQSGIWHMGSCSVSGIQSQLLLPAEQFQPAAPQAGGENLGFSGCGWQMIVFSLEIVD